MSYKRKRSSSKRPTPKQIRFANLYVSEYLPGKATLEQISIEAGYKASDAYQVMECETVKQLIHKKEIELIVSGGDGRQWLIEQNINLYEKNNQHIETVKIDKNGEETIEYNPRAAANAAGNLDKLSKMMGCDSPAKHDQIVKFDLGGVTKEDIDRWTAP